MTTAIHKRHLKKTNSYTHTQMLEHWYWLCNTVNLNLQLALTQTLFPHTRRKRSSGELSESSESTLSPDPDNLLGRRIQHTWREKGNVTKWKGTVLERLTVNSSLYMVKYDGFDCVYGIELFKDSRVSNLQVLSEKVGECDSVSSYLDPYLCFAWVYICKR